MLDLKVCMVCFSDNVKLYSLKSGNLRNEYNVISGLHTQSENGLPDFLCVYCLAYVRRSIQFRERCQRAYYALREILQRSEQIKMSHLLSFDRAKFGIMPPLSYMINEKQHYAIVKFQWVKHSRVPKISGDVIPIAHYSTLTNQDTFVDVTQTSSEAQNDLKTETYDVEFSNDLSKEVNLVEVPVLNTDNIISTTEEYFDDVPNDDINYPEEQNDYFIDNSIKDENKAEGSKLEEEYASIFSISVREAKAALEVYKMFGKGMFVCQVCNRRYQSEERLNVHMRMHDKHTSGNFHCNLCDYFYKTEFLLQTHMTEKHMYKYVCRKCCEVSFDRTTAKQHYILTHLQKGEKKNANWYESRPSWLSSKGGKRRKGVVTLRPVIKKKLPEDFLIYSPISQEEQYQIVQDRKKTSNYTDSLFKCELCYRGFREMATYEKHMKKHNPELCGRLQCDMCKLYFRDQRKIYKHMNTSHLFKYTCQLCSFSCVNRGQAHAHYKWHKNVTYSCPHCDKIFKKISTRLTHIRVKHPSTFVCNLCGHSFVSDYGLCCHKQIAHTIEERELSESTPFNKSDPYYCEDCKVNFLSEMAFDTHLGSSSKHASTNISIKPRRKSELAHKYQKTNPKRRGRPRMRGASSEIVNNGISTSTNCEVCGKFLVNDVQARKHYESEHPGTDYLKRYMCDVCGHTTRQYANLTAHMRTHTNEKPYECPHCDRRFSMPSNRDRHLVVHTGEKRFQCHHCNRRFTQSSAVKLHIQTVHLKIPYAPWEKKNRKRRKEADGANAQDSAILAATNQTCITTQHKLLLDTQGDYLNAYITYNDV